MAKIRRNRATRSNGIRYTDKQKLVAVETVRAAGGQVSEKTLADVRLVLASPTLSLSTLDTWVKKAREQTAETLANSNSRKPTQDRTPQRAPENVWGQGFLASLREMGSVTWACQAANVGRRTVYSRRENDLVFAAAWDAALEEATDRLEAEARRRAEWGTHKPVWYKGQLVGYELEYSDTLMALLLRGNRPEKFGNKLIIEIKPEHAALLKRIGVSPSDAWEAYMQELAGADTKHNS